MNTRGEVWAVLPHHVDAALWLVSLGADAPEVMSLRAAAAAASKPTARAGVAVLPLRGILTHRPSIFGLFGLGTAMTDWLPVFRSLARDPAIGTIVIDVDSPGGAVEGIQEAAAAIRAARANTRVVAVANSLMASGAYWLGSAASEVVAAPGSDVGSIGVYAVHTDISEAEAQAGRRWTLISAGKYKTEGNRYEPLSDEARAALQARVLEVHGDFVGDVAGGRGVGRPFVEQNYGQGRVLSAGRALAAGMVDRVASLDDVVGEIIAGGVRGGGSRASAPAPRRLEGAGWIHAMLRASADVREEVRRLAVHEGGHAVAYLANGVRAASVEILGELDASGALVPHGGVCTLSDEVADLWTLDVAIGALAGVAAEHVFGWVDAEPEGGDLAKARLAWKVLGYGDRTNWGLREARHLIRQHRPAVAAVADALFERGHLDGVEVEQIALAAWPELQAAS